MCVCVTLMCWVLLCISKDQACDLQKNFTVNGNSGIAFTQINDVMTTVIVNAAKIMLYYSLVVHFLGFTVLIV